MQQCIVCKSTTRRVFVQKGNFMLMQCCQCKLIFLDPLPPTTKQVYSEDYFSGALKGHGYVDYDADKNAMRPTFIAYMKLIEMYHPIKGTILDIGAATGYFMGIASESGWNAKGIEISPYAVAVGKKRGYTILCGSIAEILLPHADVITLWDVFEHLRNPDEDLSSIYNALNNEGILLINTPDTGSAYARLTKKRWHHLVPPEHLHLFNKKNITQMLENKGFKVLCIMNKGKRFTLNYIVHTIGLRIGSKNLVKLASKISTMPLGSIALQFNLWDNMLVIAKKSND